MSTDPETDPELERIRAKRMKEGIKTIGVEIRGEVLDVTDDEFVETISNNNLVVVDFWAEWCAPCRTMGPVLEELAEKHAGEVTVAKLNVDNNRRVPTQFGISSIPSLIFFKDGEPVQKTVGVITLAQIERILETIR